MNLNIKNNTFRAGLAILTVGVILSIGFYSFKKLFSKKIDEVSICKKNNWKDLKNKAFQDKLNDDEIYALNRLGYECRFFYRVKSVDIDKFLEAYKNSSNIYAKQALLSFFESVQDRDLIKDNAELVAILKSIATKESDFLSEKAARILIYNEIVKFDEAVNIFKNLKNDDSKIRILTNIISKEKYDRDKLYGFLKSLVESRDKNIASYALRSLISIEGDDKWQSWQWSSWLEETILKAANENFYLLWQLSPLEMLEITKKYPDSKFTKACIEFRSLFPGDTYFGKKYTDAFRRPFFYTKELTMHAEFMRKYPDHPAVNDILYRQARAYELEGDYNKAIILYYNSLKVGDSDVFKSVAGSRIFFITNFLMDSDSINQFISSNPNHPLNSNLLYTKALHSLKENKTEPAEKEIKQFISLFENKLLKNEFIDRSSYYDDRSISVNTYFWSEVKKQANFIKNINSIRSKPISDSTLYEEGKLWTNTDFAAYNLLALELGGYSMPVLFIPDRWDGQNTAEGYLITSSAYITATQHNQWRNRYLRSIESFTKLLNNYPKSELAAKAKYSIGLNYYFMNLRNYSFPGIEPRELGIKTFREFVEQFPENSMADDALISIADMSRDENERSEALQQIISKYPSADRRKDAEKMISKNPPSSSYSSSNNSNVSLGIELNNYDNEKVVINKVFFNSLASKNGLKEGDIVVKVMGEPMKSSSDVVSKIKSYQPGDIIRIQIIRDNKLSIFEIEAPE